MLNQELYKALKSLYGEVRISNENQRPTIIKDPTKLQMWRTPKGVDEGDRGEQYHVNCPFCGDTRFRLYIGCMSFARPSCDGVELPAGELTAYCQNENCTADPSKFDALNTAIAAKLDGKEVSLSSSAPTGADERPQFSDHVDLDGIRTWVPEYRPVDGDADPEILEYLQSRRITMQDVQWLHIGYGPIRTRSKGLLKHGCPWVIFPIVQNDTLVGIQARCPDKFMEGPDDKLKYYFHPACRKAGAVYNIDSARTLGLAVVCEGVFDVASIGRPGVCCFGHTPSTLQKSMLASVGTALIWLPDTDKNPQCDPVDIARKQVERWNAASTFTLGAHVVVLPEKDAGSMTRAEVWSCIMEQLPDMSGYITERILDRL